MKKKLLLLFLLFGLIILPTTIKAETKYNSLNFKEALADEQIEEKFKEYKETDDQVTIYLFRGKGCGFCRSFLEFMNSITDEYGKYFKIVSYEVWGDSANSQLLNEVSNFLGKSAGGVPYIIIGERVFTGYSSSSDEDIKATIKEMYDTKVKNRYDVLKEMKKNGKDSSDSSLSNSSVWIIIICNLVITVVASLFIMSHINNKYNDLRVMFESKRNYHEKTINKPKK